MRQFYKVGLIPRPAAGFRRVEKKKMRKFGCAKYTNVSF